MRKGSFNIKRRGEQNVQDLDQAVLPSRVVDLETETCHSRKCRGSAVSIRGFERARLWVQDIRGEWYGGSYARRRELGYDCVGFGSASETEGEFSALHTKRTEVTGIQVATGVWAFTFAERDLDKIVAYVKNQKAHHAKGSILDWLECDVRG